MTDEQESMQNSKPLDWHDPAVKAIKAKLTPEELETLRRIHLEEDEVSRYWDFEEEQAEIRAEHERERQEAEAILQHPESHGGADSVVVKWARRTVEGGWF